MPKQRLLTITVVWLVLGIAGSAAWADLTFETLPSSGKIAGPAGSTIGWGYSIADTSSSDWFVATGLDAGVFADATPNASIFDFPILSPGETLNVAYDPVHGLGLYEQTWKLTAPVGFVNSGNFTLSADEYNGDPLAGGTFLSSVRLTTPYSATVSAVPEPSTLLLLATGSALLGLRKRRRAKRETGRAREHPSCGIITTLGPSS